MLWWLIVYLVGMPIVPVWDAYIGFGDGVNFDGHIYPPMWLVMLCWPLFISGALLYWVAFYPIAYAADWLNDVKQRRIVHQRRVAHQKGRVL